MHCLNCGFENSSDVRFCAACGNALPRLCHVCGEINPVRFKFCGSCGSPLAAQAPDRPAAPELTAARAEPPIASEPDAPADPERRHLTVMFCDLVGSTALSVRLDPEELRDVVRSYQSSCADVIERFGGYIAQYLGDGVLVYFGFPVALEDEADRAVGAGLGILEAIGTLNQRLKPTLGIDVAVRVGIHTGVVVVGEVGRGSRREHLALGDTPNIAARLQNLASPGEVVVSSETYRLAARAFEFDEIGSHSIKGVTTPEPVYRVVRARRIEGPGTGRPDGRAASLLGRDHELSLILDRWQQVRQGQGRVLCISGDPGIGKSHLVHEFKRRLDVTDVTRLDARCLPYYRNTAFFPFLDLFRRGADGSAGPLSDSRLDGLIEWLEHDGPHAEPLPLVTTLLAASAAPSRAADPPPLLKEKTRSALIQLLLETAQERPLVLTIEDLHWADPSTLELLDQLMPLVEGSRLLLLFTFRPELGVRWAGHGFVTHVYLGRIQRHQVEELVTEVAGGRTMPPEVIAQIVARTDGVPLFVEELTKMLLESGLLEERGGGYQLRGPLPPLAIPTTLRDSLEARLDRLSAVKEIAQLGASIGREFTYELLRAVSPAPEAALQQALVELADAGLLYARGSAPHVTYIFKHALIQEAAYQSLLRTTRQRHHQRIATTLEQRFPETAAAAPELLAFHYTAAGLNEPAIDAWLRAGRRALERSANAEAVAHLRQGLDLLETLPDSSERAARELELLCTLAPALAAKRGYTAAEVRDVYLRARDLSVSAQRPDTLIQVLVGLFAYHFARAELDQAAHTAAELLHHAERSGNARAWLAANAATGVMSLASGGLAAAKEHLDRVIHAYDPAKHAGLAITFGQDFGVVGLAYSALLLWLTGCPDQARARAREALALAERLRHPHSIALALSIGASIHHFSRDVEAVFEWAGQLEELANAQAFAHWLAEARFLLAWATAHDGRVDEALLLLDAELEAARAADAATHYRYYHRTIAELLTLAGRAAEAIELLDGLDASIGQTEIGWWWDSEVYRLRAELALTLDPDDPSAEREFQHALEVARARFARSLELRAAIGLARLWKQRGRTADARALLADCYEGFTEGFETGDLIETRLLLEELDAAVPA